MTTSRINPKLGIRRAVALAAAAAALACAAACQSGATNPPDSHSTAGSPQSPAAPGAPAAGAPAAGDGDFCALIKQKGGEDLLALGDSPGDGDVDALLANLDTMDAAAPADIKPDFDNLDKLEHAMFGSGSLDPSAVDHLQDPDVAASLQHVRDYLTNRCHIDQ